MVQNNAGKQFSTGIYNRKTLEIVTALFLGLFQKDSDFVSSILGAQNLFAQIKGLCKLVSVTKGKSF